MTFSVNTSGLDALAALGTGSPVRPVALGFAPVQPVAAKKRDTWATVGKLGAAALGAIAAARLLDGIMRDAGHDPNAPRPAIDPFPAEQRSFGDDYGMDYEAMYAASPALGFDVPSPDPFGPRALELQPLPVGIPLPPMPPAANVQASEVDSLLLQYIGSLQQSAAREGTKLDVGEPSSATAQPLDLTAPPVGQPLAPSAAPSASQADVRRIEQGIERKAKRKQAKR